MGVILVGLQVGVELGKDWETSKPLTRNREKQKDTGLGKAAGDC